MTSRARGVIPEWTLADRLEKAFNLAGRPEAELMRELDASAGTVTNYRKGNTRARQPAVRIWAEVTGVDFDWLWTGNDPQPVPRDSLQGSDDPDRKPPTRRAAQGRGGRRITGSEHVRAEKDREV